MPWSPSRGYESSWAEREARRPISPRAVGSSASAAPPRGPHGVPGRLERPRQEREEGLGLTRDTVPAAGGVVYRRNGEDELEVLLVHRPRYGDWTLPKGKLHRGESHEEGALREVEEETGLRCELGRGSFEPRHGSEGQGEGLRYWTRPSRDVPTP